MKVPGEAAHKRYRVMHDAPGGEVLASFDTSEEAISHAQTLRLDRRYVVRDYGGKIVWPEKRQTP